MMKSKHEKQIFIDYAKKANGILKLNAQETVALINHRKRKFASVTSLSAFTTSQCPLPAQANALRLAQAGE